MDVFELRTGWRMAICNARLNTGVVELVSGERNVPLTDSTGNECGRVGRLTCAE